MSDIAQAYVRIRPNTAGFQQEAEAQLKGATSGISRALAFTIGAAGLGEGLKKLVEEAASHESAVAQTQAAVKAAGAQWVVYGQNVEQALDKQARASGFSFEELYQAFIRIETQVKNTPKALQILGEAEDVARARHLGLAQAATALSRASAGNVQSLSRLGIIVPKATEAQDALKAKLLEVAHAQEAQSEAAAKHYIGTIHLTAAELALTKLSPIRLKELAENIKAQEASAKASDLQGSAAKALAEVQARYGGQAATFAKSAAGQYARFRVEVEEAAAELGKVLLPYLSDAAQQAGEWARKVGESKGAAEALKTGAHDVAGAVRSIGTTIKAVEPELKLLAETVQAIGAGPILAAFAAYKALGVGLGVVAKAQKVFVGLETAGAAASGRRNAALAAEADAEAAAAAVRAEAVATYGEEAVAITENMDALIAQTEALLGNTAAQEANGAAAAAAGAEQAAAGVGRFAAASEGLGLALASPAGAVIGVSALAGAVYYLSTITPAGVQHTNDLRDAYNRLAGAARDVTKAQNQVRDDRKLVTTARDARDAAAAALTAARKLLDADVLTGKGADIQAAAAKRVADAEAAWRTANSTLITSEHATKAAVAAASDELKKQRKAYQDLITSQAELAAFDSHVGVGARGANLSKNIDDYVRQLRTVISTTKGLTAAQKLQLTILANYAEDVRRIPSSKTVTLILNDTSFLATLQKDYALIKGAAGAFLSIFQPPSASDSRGGPSLTVQAKKTGGQLGSTAGDAFTTNFVETIDAGTIAKALADAIASAQQQLTSLSGDLSGTIDATLDARLAKAEGKIDAADARIQGRIQARQAAADARNSSLAGESAATKLAQLQAVLGTGALTADQTLALQAAKNAVLDAQDTVANAADAASSDALGKKKDALDAQEKAQKDAADRQVADLTDSFNRGLISQATYLKRIRALLAKDGVNFKTTGKLLGSAFADGFRDELTSIVAQVKALGLVGPAALKKARTGTDAISPVKAEADAIQAFIDQVAGSGGKFKVKNAETLPPGVDLKGLLSAAGVQRAESAYREKTSKQNDTALRYAGETSDHTRDVLAELKKHKPVSVTVVVDDGARKRKIAQATK